MTHGAGTRRGGRGRWPSQGGMQVVQQGGTAQRRSSFSSPHLGLQDVTEELSVSDDDEDSYRNG